MFFELITVFQILGLSFTQVSLTATSIVSTPVNTTAAPKVYSMNTTTTSPIVPTTSLSISPTQTVDPPTSTSVFSSTSAPPPEDCSASGEPTTNSTCFQFSADLLNHDRKKEYFDLKQKISDDFCETFKLNATKVWLLELTFCKTDESWTIVKGKICMVFKSGNDFEMEDAQLNFTTKYTFEATGVTFSEWKAKNGECKKCDGGGGPFVIERVCESKNYSCKGHKNKSQESKDCVKYCPSASSLVVAAVSNLILAMWISLSFNF